MYLHFGQYICLTKEFPRGRKYRLNVKVLLRGWSFRGVAANMHNCRIIVSEFDHQSRCNMHFQEKIKFPYLNNCSFWPHWLGL